MTASRLEFQLLKFELGLRDLYHPSVRGTPRSAQITHLQESANTVHHTCVRSVDEVSGSGTVDLSEGNVCALVKEGFRVEAQVLIVSVGGHARLEALEVIWAELDEDVLTWGTFIFSGEATGQTDRLTIRRGPK